MIEVMRQIHRKNTIHFIELQNFDGFAKIIDQNMIENVETSIDKPSSVKKLHLRPILSAQFKWKLYSVNFHFSPFFRWILGNFRDGFESHVIILALFHHYIPKPIQISG
jgi:hypothetical protein